MYGKTNRKRGRSAWPILEERSALCKRDSGAL